MNQMTWDQVLVWERLHREECGCPSLVRFLGKPDSLSPRARMRKLFTGAWVCCAACTRSLCAG